jgi:hypothetical protein
MDPFNISSATSQGNALTRDATEHNQRVDAARDALKVQYQGQTQTDKKQADWDKDIYQAHDALQSISLGAKYPVWTKSKAMFKTSEGLRDFATQQVAYGKEKNPFFFGISSGAGKGGTEAGAVARGEPSETLTRADLINAPEGEGPQGAVFREPQEPHTTPLESDSAVHETAVSTDATTPEATGARDLTEEVSGDESLLDKGISGAKDILEKGGGALRIAGNVGGYIDDYDLIKDGFKSNASTGLGKASQYLSGAGALLDTIGIAVPVLEPLGAIASLAGAITDSVSTHKEDAQTIKDDPKNLQTALGHETYQKNVPLSNMGLIATQNNHIQSNTASTGSF